LTRADDIAHENLFYGIRGLSTDGIERGIANVEREFFVKPYREFVLKRNFSKTSHETKKWFFVFLAFQMMRTNQSRLDLKASYKGMAEELNKDTLAEPLKSEVETILKRIDDPDYLKAIHSVDLLLPPLDYLFELTKYFFNKKWVILITKRPLWSSDNPISFYNSFDYEGNLGILSKGVEIRFPLSSNLLLYSYDPLTNPTRRNKDKMGTSEFEQANICQLKWATRFIYCGLDQFDLANDFLSKNPRFKDPDRVRWKIVDHGSWIEEIKLE
jgi:hypothetical protein